MQTEDQRRSDEAAAQAYVATLLQQSGLAAFLPVLQEMAGAPGVPLCMRVRRCFTHYTDTVCGRQGDYSMVGCTHCGGLIGC